MELVLGEDKLSKKIYVGNLSFEATEEQVRELFGQHGTVESVALINDRDTGRFRGFGFVEMDDVSAAAEAIKASGRQRSRRTCPESQRSAAARRSSPSSFGGDRHRGGRSTVVAAVAFGGGRRDSGNRSGGGNSGGNSGRRQLVISEPVTQLNLNSFVGLKKTVSFTGSGLFILG
jgi:cold-inducible RNA-binding protein